MQKEKIKSKGHPNLKIERRGSSSFGEIRFLPGLINIHDLNAMLISYGRRGLNTKIHSSYIPIPVAIDVLTASNFFLVDEFIQWVEQPGDNHEELLFMPQPFFVKVISVGNNDHYWVVRSVLTALNIKRSTTAIVKGIEYPHCQKRRFDLVQGISKREHIVVTRIGIYKLIKNIGKHCDEDFKLWVNYCYRTKLKQFTVNVPETIVNGQIINSKDGRLHLASVCRAVGVSIEGVKRINGINEFIVYVDFGNGVEYGILPDAVSLILSNYYTIMLKEINAESREEIGK